MIFWDSGAVGERSVLGMGGIGVRWGAEPSSGARRGGGAPAGARQTDGDGDGDEDGDGDGDEVRRRKVRTCRVCAGDSGWKWARLRAMGTRLGMGTRLLVVSGGHPGAAARASDASARIRCPDGSSSY